MQFLQTHTNIGELIFSIGLIFLAVVSSLQLVRKDHWIYRMADFPHFQLTVLTLICLMGTIIFGRFSDWPNYMVVAIGLGTLIYQIIVIFPYTPLANKQVKDWDPKSKASVFSILEANVFMENSDFEKLIQLIETHQPDIVITLETDSKWEKALKPIDTKYRYSIKKPMDNTYGMLVYSKLELSNSKIQFLIEDHVPSVETDVLLKNGETIRLYIVHPQPPSPSENERSTERDAELVVVGKKTKTCSLPVIVAGDLNDVAWSHTTRLFQRISGLLDPRIGRGFFNTYHAKYAFFRWPLDHIFHSEHFLIKTIQRLPFIGSDHFPMLIELCLNSEDGKKRNGKPDSPDDEDTEEARNTVKKAKE